MNIFYVSGRAAVATKLVFTDKFDERLDIWGMQFLSMKKAYISNQLINRLKKEHIRGYQAYPSKCKLIFTFNSALPTKRIIHRQVK